MKKMIVVGATSGIGREVVKLMAERGWLIGVAGRRIELLESLKEELPSVIAYKQIDVTKEDASGLLRELIDEMGGIDLYFHSSGIGWHNVPLDIDKELATVNTNAMGFTSMITAAFEYFAQSGKAGHIAAISSIAGTKGLGAAPAYSATKRFQNHYIECLQQLANIRHLPIRFTDIRPGFVSTELIKGSSFPMQLQARYVATHIVKAIERGKASVVIDWKYSIVVAFWKLIPHWLWIRLRIA